MRKICIYTSTRAEWGLLQGVASEVARHDGLKLQLLVSGSHLAGRFGSTVSEIESAGHVVDERVDVLKFDDTPQGVCQTMGLAIPAYGEALIRLQPDIVLVLGDRYEAFCAAIAAQVHRIPVAHIHGGETTEGAMDEAFRHSISKLAQLHFPACEEYRSRIIQLGEAPERVFDVGALGVENIGRIPLMSREELGRSMGFGVEGPYFLVTYHPATLEGAPVGEQFGALLAALDSFPGHRVLFTGANADPGGSVVNTGIQEYVGVHSERCFAVESLGMRRYLSAMSFCDAVIGNSSSGILEAPAFRIPTVNIGDRQKGRVRAPSVIDCETECGSIVRAINIALSPEFGRGLQEMENPFAKENTAANIVTTLATSDLSGLLQKSFFNLPGAGGG